MRYDLMLGEQTEDEIVELRRALEIASERLLDDDAHPRPLVGRPRARRESARRQIAHDRLEDARRHGEIEQPIAVLGRARSLDLGEPLADLLVVLRIGEIDAGVDAAARITSPATASSSTPCTSSDLLSASRMRARNVSSLSHARRGRRRARRNPRRRDALSSADRSPACSLRVVRSPSAPKITIVHGSARSRAGAMPLICTLGRAVTTGAGAHDFFTAWPPNSLRSAAMTLAPNESVWRERKRMSSESVMTGAGTSRSIASCTVQRPSPESATQPLRSDERRVAREGASPRAR